MVMEDETTSVAGDLASFSNDSSGPPSPRSSDLQSPTPTEVDEDNFQQNLTVKGTGEKMRYSSIIGPILDIFALGTHYRGYPCPTPSF